jgi:hypothetical protein
MESGGEPRALHNLAEFWLGVAQGCGDEAELVVGVVGEGFFDGAEEATGEALEGGADFLLFGRSDEGGDVEFFAGGNGRSEVVDDGAARNFAEGGDFVGGFAFAEVTEGFARGVADGGEARRQGGLSVEGFENQFVVGRQIFANFGGEGVGEFGEFLGADAGDARESFGGSGIFAGHVAQG